jgi:hypothetical protein
MQRMTEKNSSSIENTVCQKVFEELQRDGLAKVSWEELFHKNLKESVLFTNLSETAAALSDRAPVIEGQGAKTSPKDAYSVRDRDYFGHPNPYLLSFALSRQVFKIVQMYLGPDAYFYNAEQWLHFSSEDFDRVSAQLWHRDPEGKKILKVFVMMQDVSPACGPTEMILGSQRTGSRKSLARFSYNQVEMRQDEVESMINNSDATVAAATGKIGDICFIDTSCIHRGGYGRENRLLSSFCFLPKKMSYLRRTSSAPSWVR